MLTTLFVLRLVGAAVLLLFLGVLMWLIYRDMQTTADLLQEQQRPRGYLRVLQTESVQLDADMRLPLLPVTGIGRAPSNTLMLEDDYASGEHALITLRGGQWWVEDLNSRNGTLLNEQILRQPAVVSSGDVITVGTTILRVEL